MFAIQHKETGRFVTGTDFSRTTDDGFRQFVFTEPLKVYECKADAISDMKARKCGKGYKVVEVEV